MYFFNEVSTATVSPLSGDKLNFFYKNRFEIMDIYKSKNPWGKWKKLGSGMAKIVLEHPDLPGMVIKIPKEKGFIKHTRKTCDDFLRAHHINLERARTISAQFDRIYLPESHLFQMGTAGLMIVEEKISFAGQWPIPDSSDKVEAMNQFEAFQRATGLCDTRWNENLDMIDQMSPLTVGIIDFDCQWDTTNEKE